MIWVSAQHGNDANAGTLAAPVREIARAMEVAVEGDTVVVLDSGEYRSFQVNKSLAVVAEGVHAEVSGESTSSGGAIGVDPGSAGVVLLRGLAVRGASTGPDVGIDVNSGRVQVEHCRISNFGARPDQFPARGIRAVSGTGFVLTVVDTVLGDNLGAIETLGEGAARVSISRCVLYGDSGANSFGIRAGQNMMVAVADSLVTGFDLGVWSRGLAGSRRATLALTGTTVTHNGTGVYSDKVAQVLLTRCTVTLNDKGLFTLNDGVIYTAGDNAVFGNFSQNIGAGTMHLTSDLSG
jgi:hypothetical protein